MRELVVLYDAHCGLCVRCRLWLARQSQWVPIRMLPRDSVEAEARFPSLTPIVPPDELVAIADDGAVYWGARAWLICLWALEEYREWALWLASPMLMPLARRTFAHVSKNRDWISRLVSKPGEWELRRSSVRVSACSSCN